MRSIVLVASAVLVAADIACAPRQAQIATPERLAAQALIRRDTFGIPHILADTEEAASFALGFAQAEDHVLELVRRYIRARGEEALYFGETGLENDLAMAQFDNLSEARKGLTELSPEFRRIVESFVAGVNRYIERNRRSLPDWVPVIEPVDIVAHSRAGAVNALAGPAIPRQLAQKYPPSPLRGAGEASGSRLTIDDDADDEAGSNAFALAGSRTTTGKPILLGNPHLSWSSLYWEAHVRVPGRIDFYGSTLIGIPVLRAGFNDRLGFVTTNNAPDLDDVFALPMDSQDEHAYRFDGRAMPLERRDVAIRIRSADGTVRTENRTFWRSHLGPVVYRTAQKAFVIKSTRLDAHRYFEGFYVLSRARSLAEWRRALGRNLVPTSNFTYADADGNILYQWNGRLPVRKAGVDYRLDVDANGAKDVWSTLHSVDDLPRLLNPPGGYVQNANNPPRFVSLSDPIAIDRYPPEFERGPLALRPQLALDLLGRQQRFSGQDVIALKFNTRVLLAERVRQPLIDAVRTLENPSETATEGAAVLETWDGRAAASSRGAVLFQRFWDGYAAKVREPFATPWEAENPASTPAGLSNPAEAVAQLESAVRATREAFGSESVAWGEAHRFRIGSVDLPGDGATGTYGAFRVLRFDAVQDQRARLAGNIARGRPLVGFGDAWVLVVDFSRPTTGWSVLAYGQTADLDSPHSRDQIRLFADHQLRRAWYTESEIRANLEREYRPE